jgi:hypothetical protein
MKLFFLFALLTLSVTVNAQCPAPQHYQISSTSYQCDNNGCTIGTRFVSWSPNGQGYPSTYIVYYRKQGSNSKPKDITVQSWDSNTGASACWISGLHTNTTYEWWVANVSCGTPVLSTVKTFTTPNNFNY